MNLSPRPARVKCGPLTRQHLAAKVAELSDKAGSPSISILSRALDLLAGEWPAGVEWCAAEGVYLVASQTDPARCYELANKDARCACHAGQHGRYCAHRAAVALFPFAARLAAQEAAGLLEAPRGPLAALSRGAAEDRTRALHAANAKARREAICGTRADAGEAGDL